MKLPHPHGIAMQTLPLDIGVKEFAGEEHVVMTTAMATMVFPVKGMVKDIAVGSSTGAVDTHHLSSFTLDTRGMEAMPDMTPVTVPIFARSSWQPTVLRLILST